MNQWLNESIFPAGNIGALWCRPPDVLGHGRHFVVDRLDRDAVRLDWETPPMMTSQGTQK